MTPSYSTPRPTCGGVVTVLPIVSLFVYVARGSALLYVVYRLPRV